MNGKATTTDPRDWVERLALQYGSMQAANLRGDNGGAWTAHFWMLEACKDHWHEIIAALRQQRQNAQAGVGAIVCKTGD